MDSSDLRNEIVESQKFKIDLLKALHSVANRNENAVLAVVSFIAATTSIWTGCRRNRRMKAKVEATS